jgi:hypothetical protein
LKPDDPAWADLVTEIESVVSHRFVEDAAASWRPFYMPSEAEPGFAFASLNREDRLDLLADLVSWRDYKLQGMSYEQQRIVVENVLDGKPQEKWLEGVFDEAVVEGRKIDSFKTSVEIMRLSPDNHVFEEMDGDRRPWAELSAAAKLQYIALDAARCDVGFEPFAQVVKDTIGDIGEVALRVVLDGQKELHAIAKLFPDDGRTEPTPLVDRVKDALDYVSVLETQERARTLNAELKDHGQSESLPSREGKPMTDDERKLVWMETIRRLDAAYTAGGTDALGKMNGIEIHVLYDEKAAELEAVRKSLAEHGGDEIGQLHRQKLERQTADMGAWMRVHCPDFREMEQKASKTSLADLKAAGQREQALREKTGDKGMER